MAAVADFGPLVVETDVDVAVVRTLRLWLPTYLAQAERDRGLADRLLARPVEESYANTLEDDEFLDHRLPAIIVTTAQTSGEPLKDGRGIYSVPWLVVVSSVVRGRTPPETRAVAALFGGCVRRCLVQQADLGGAVQGVWWVASNVAAVPDVTDQGRYLAAGINRFTVLVDEALDAYGGPTIPADYGPDPDPADPDTPYDPLAAVGDVIIDVAATTPGA